MRQSRPASAEAEWSDSKGDPSCALSPASGRTGHRPNGLVLASLNKTISSLNLHNLYGIALPIAHASNRLALQCPPPR